MTFSNSILIIIKQNNGIDYNDLFARIASRYKNHSSAHSALSRALKNLVSFGLLQKKENHYFITDKGLSSVSIEMKEKLVLKINESIKKPLSNVQEIVQLLIVLSQRASLDADLLKNARENASFTISDISAVRKVLHNRRVFLKKMDSLLKVQEEKLKEINFNDSQELIFDEHLVKKIISFSAGQKVLAEISDSDVLEKIPLQWKKGNEISVEGDDIQKFFSLLLENSFTKATIYIPKIKIILRSGKAVCSSQFQTLNEFLNTK
jgi:predicted transcriptional regulator